MADSKLVLNVAPITFSAATFPAGFLAFKDDESYAALREEHRTTHVFRFDARTGLIANVALAEGTPMGDVREVAVEDQLLLLGKAVQHSLSEWLRPTSEVLKLARPIRFFGKAPRSRLLKFAASEVGVAIDPRIDVVVRYHIDTRIVTHPDTKKLPYLGLVLDVNTSNVLDLSVADLVAAGVDVNGKYVCKIATPDEDGLRPRPDILGVVSHIDGDQIALGDPRDCRSCQYGMLLLSLVRKISKPLCKRCIQLTPRDSLIACVSCAALTPARTESVPSS